VLRNGIFYPQRAKGTHRAEGNIAFAKGKNITSSLFKVSLKNIERRKKTSVETEVFR